MMMKTKKWKMQRVEEMMMKKTKKRQITAYLFFSQASDSYFSAHAYAYDTRLT